MPIIYVKCPTCGDGGPKEIHKERPAPFKKKIEVAVCESCGQKISVS